MDYEDMIEDEPEPVTTPPEAELEPEPEPSRPKSPWKAFIITGVLAGLIGAVGGAIAVYLALEKHMSDRYMTAQPIKADLQQELRTETARLEERLEGIELQVSNLPEPTSVTDAIDLSPIEDRLTALESVPSPEIDPDALIALKTAQEDGFQWPDVSALEGRIAALETDAAAQDEAVIPEELMERLSNLETQIDTQNATEPDDAADLERLIERMSEIDSRVSTLENRPLPEPVVERVSILAFPKAQLIEAVEDNQKGGLIEKTLSRHIRVKDANDPLTLIDGIEADISEGRLAAAAKKFERLPSPVRAAGQAWYDSVKASL